MLEHVLSPKNLKEHMLGIVATLFVALILFIQEGETQIKRIVDRGEIRFIMRSSANQHYTESESKAEEGFDQKFAQLFAEYLNVDLKMETVDTVHDALLALDEDKGDIATGLADDVDREPVVRYSKPYQIIDEKVVYKIGKHKPKSFSELSSGKLVVGSQTSYAEKLESLQVKYTKLKYETTDQYDPFTLMDKVISGEIDYTIVDSVDLEQYRRFHPELAVAFDFEKAQDLAMAFKPYTRYPGLYKLLGNLKEVMFPETLTWVQNHLPLDNSLVRKVNTFLDELDDSGQLDWLLDIYYGHLQDFDILDTRTFLRRTKNILPRYIPTFKLAAKTDLTWELLAAIAYQESHWNPNATSPTGVRGMMMLTMNTARSLRVTNRLDPTQSIQGGAQYFRRIYHLLPADIQEPDRTWITLASYNIGLGHILDVRKLIQRNGGDPNKWQEIRQWLPRKHQAKWYSQTRYGYARGREAMIYVENIRRYHDLLKWLSEKDAQEE